MGVTPAKAHWLEANALDDQRNNPTSGNGHETRHAVPKGRSKTPPAPS